MSGKSLIPIFAFVALWLIAACTGSADTVTNCDIKALIGAINVDQTAVFEEDCSITLTNQIVIKTNVTIDATDQTVTLAGGSNGTNGFRLFYIRNGGTLNLIHVILTAGRTNVGGAIYIEPGGTLNADSCTFAGNVAVGANGLSGTNGVSNSGTGGNGTSATGGAPAFGGAIFNLGTLTLTTCTFHTNSATGGTGGNGGAGGTGGYQGGNGGAAGNGAMAMGGAIYDGGDSSTISDCLFDGNAAVGGSGGTGGTAGSGPFLGFPGNGGSGATAYGAAYLSTGFCAVARCTFENNSVQGGNSMTGGSSGNAGNSGAKGGDVYGGGLCLFGPSDPDLTNSVENCTFFQNQLQGGSGGNGGSGSYTGGNGGNGGTATGGGIYNTGRVTIVNCTLANCGAFRGTNGTGGSAPFPGSSGSLGAQHGGNVASAGGVLYFQNSITVTNLAGGNVYRRVTGNFVDAGYNISSDASFSFSGTSRKNTNPLLQPLADNGGATPTMALPTNSPATDYIPLFGVFPATDQRGVLRPNGRGADIGAFEIGPALIDQPTDQTTTVGGSATFSVTASSDDATFQWQFNGSDIPGATDASLTVTNLTPATRGPYAVVVTDSTGTSISDSASVHFAPGFVTPPASQTVPTGSNAVFSTTYTGDTNVYIRWLFGTNLLQVTTNVGSAITNSSSLQRLALSTNDVGSYSVSLSNKFGTVTSPFSLALGTAPSIQSQPASQTNTVGSSATFSVTASGNPAPAYQWQFNGANLDGQTASAFTLNNMQPTNQGTYTVIVTNAVGTNTASATLTVIAGGAPSIINNPSPQIALVNSTASFSVAASGTAPITYQWRLNSSPIQGAVGASYSISGVAPEDAGAYDVIVGNGLGSTRSSKANLTVVTSVVPPVITVINTGAAFGLSFTGFAGASYTIDARTNILAGTWTPISTNPGNGGVMRISIPRTNSSSFFRVRTR